jgi:lysozyme family protein
MFDDIVNELLALQLFDWSVTSGVSKAVKVLQKIVVTNQDGEMGNHTITETNKKDYSSQYIIARQNFYKAIGVGKNSVFLKGWLNRISNTTKALK